MVCPRTNAVLLTLGKEGLEVALCSSWLQRIVVHSAVPAPTRVANSASRISVRRVLSAVPLVRVVARGPSAQSGLPQFPQQPIPTALPVPLQLHMPACATADAMIPAPPSVSTSDSIQPGIKQTAATRVLPLCAVLAPCLPSQRTCQCTECMACSRE